MLRLVVCLSRLWTDDFWLSQCDPVWMSCNFSLCLVLANTSLSIFTCVASQHLILCDITATTTTTTTAAARFLNFYLEQFRRQDSRGCSTGRLSVKLQTIFECVQFVHTLYNIITE